MRIRFVLVTLLFLAALVPTLAQRWAQAQLPSPYDQGYYLDIYFLPSNQLYGWACDNDSGYVVRTTNGGKSWQGTRVTPSGFCHLEYIQFLTTTTGYCSGPCGVFKSTDGGASWTQVMAGTPSIVVWGGWFKSEQEGWVLGGGCGVNNFYHTTDGGTTWSLYQDTTVKRSNLSDPLWQADMASGELYASGNGTLWHSTNDGDSWFVESYTGTDAPWQEELARYSTTFMIACSQSNCVANTGFGGMRWSHDDGATWNQYNTGADMFGCYLLSEQKAWASGRSANVWYTANGGTSWSKYNCGLSGKNLDDIFFLNDSTGWVVGDGLFYLAPPRRTQTDSLLEFLGACPDSTVRDTVWVTNENFTESPWTIELTGTDAWMYRVANVIPKPLPACTPVPVIVEYKAVAPGNHPAQMVIRINNPDTVLVVDLVGLRRTLNAGPRDTLIEFSQKVGVPISRVLEWRATAAPIEQIVNIQRDTGSAILSMIAAYPQPINVVAPICQTPIMGTLVDTGWVSARFRVTLAPCYRDTLVTVRVYGQSGIINAPKTLGADLFCATSDTLLVPISNTGNMDLTVYNAELGGLNPESFAILEMKRAGKSNPWKIAPGEADTLLVFIQPRSNVQQAVLRINHDDATTVRGIVQPWEIRLTATAAAQAETTVLPTEIDLGIMCVGSAVDTLFTVSNASSFDANYIVTTGSTNITLASFATTRVKANASKIERFSYQCATMGNFTDTIAVRVSPCNVLHSVIVRAQVVETELQVVPSPLQDSVFVGDVLTTSVAIRNTTNRPITINSVRSSITDAELSVNVNVPTTVAPTDSLMVQLTWKPSTVRILASQLIVESDAACAVQSNFELHSLSNLVEVSPPQLSLRQHCSAEVKYDSVRVTARSSSVSFAAPRLSVADGFSIVRPVGPFVVDRSTPVYVVVAFDPSVSLGVSDTLTLATADHSSVFTVPLVGSAYLAEWTVDPRDLDLGIVHGCDTIVSTQVVVQNLAPNPLVVDRIAISGAWLSIPAAGNLPLVVDGMSADTLMVECNPAQVPAGVATATIEFNDHNCNTTKVVTLTVQRVEDMLVLAPNPVDAGVVDTGRTVQRTAYVYNPTSTPLAISSLRVATGQSEWVMMDNVDGTVVQPMDTVFVQLSYTPHTDATHVTQLTLVQGEPCKSSMTIELRGRGRIPGVPPQYVCMIEAPEQRVVHGDRVQVPITWVGDVSAARIDSVAFTVDFYHLLFHVDAVIPATMPDVETAYTYANGTLTVMMRADSMRLGRPGTLITLGGIASLAIPDSTLFTFRDIRVWSADTVTVLDNPGLLIVDACGPRNIVSLTSPTSLQVLPPLPASDRVMLSLDVANRTNVSVELFSIEGDKVYAMNEQEAQRGKLAIAVPVHNLASGTYLVLVRTTNGGLFSAPIQVVH